MLTPNVLYWWLVPLLTWSTIWKGIALWKSGRKNQLAWFIIIFILNTAGILPIIYLLFFQRRLRKVKVIKPVKKEVKKKEISSYTKKKVSKKKPTKKIAKRKVSRKKK